MQEHMSPPNSSRSTPSVSKEDLLKFYQKKYEDQQRKEDKYKEKVDRHLKNLVADRYELEEELLRRGEKIADLQKALVELQLSVFEERERFLKVTFENEELKRKEEQLHESIRQLLAVTNHQELRDKIIYILKEPRVEIRYQNDFTTKSKLSQDTSANQKLKQELEYLKHQLEEVLQVSKNKADIVLEDCKQALERSKMKIMEDEIEIKELQKKLHDLMAQEKNINPVVAARSVSIESQNVKSTGADISLKFSREKSKTTAEAATSVSREHRSVKPETSDTEIFSVICSQFKDIHLSLILLTKVTSKVNVTLNSMQATKLFQRTAKIPKVPSDIEYHVEENTIQQLETSLRQCTRLTFDINNMYKCLCKYVSNKRKIENIAVLKSELKHLEEMLREMSIITADNDLLNVGLVRSAFFKVLRDSSVRISEADRLHYLSDFRKIVSNSETLSKLVSKATDFVESVIEKYKVQRNFHDIADSLRDFSKESFALKSSAVQDRITAQSDNDAVSLKQAKFRSLEDHENLIGIYKRTIKDAENLGLGSSTESKLLYEKIKAMEKFQEESELKKSDNFNEDIMEPAIPKAKSPQTDYVDILKKIDKTLSKVQLMEQGKYLKDEEMCRKLSENVNALTKQFKQLTEEFNVKSIQNQFSEYSKVTLSKLEELAKQSRNSVIAAEAQIAAHRSNAKHLSEKLKETEDLLRESINECLSLKQKLKQAETEHELEKYKMISGFKEKIEKHGSEGADNLIDELVSELFLYQDTKMSPFVCIYCRQGSGHKFCEDKIKELTAESRQYKTQLKLLQQDTKKEKTVLKENKEIAEKEVVDLAKENRAMKESLEASEKRIASLLEQLKLEKKRLKNMERFRRLEIAGFQTDIQQLKSKIRDLEKQLLKAVVIFETGEKDMELLKTVHETAYRTKQATAALKRLKAKLYELENDIKSL